jgi:hypothetical protein
MRKREWKRLKDGDKVIAKCEIYGHNVPTVIKEDVGYVIQNKHNCVIVRFQPNNGRADVHWLEVRLPKKKPDVWGLTKEYFNNYSESELIRIIKLAQEELKEFNPLINSGLTEEEKIIAKSHRLGQGRIRAIKAVRKRTNLSLGTSRSMVDNYLASVRD